MTVANRITGLGVAILALRMLGLFSVVPVFSLLAPGLQGATPLLVGVAVGIYGLSQALLQVPLGYWSDRIGRKPVIIGGLLMFIAGSLVAALSTSIWGVLLGRSLQGAGAIASTVVALIADHTALRQRTRAMAMVGAGMGASFLLAIVLGPWLGRWESLGVMFGCAAGLGVVALGLALSLPAATTVSVSRTGLGPSIRSALGNARFQPWYFSIFLLHLLLTALFVVLPLMLHARYQLNVASHGTVYLLTMLGSFMLAVPALLLGERAGRGWSMRLVGMALLGLGALQIHSGNSLEQAGAGLFVFFVGFNMLEASLPSGLSKRVGRHQRGVVMGVFASCQFFGAFAGGALAGILLQVADLEALLVVMAGLAFVWLVAFVLLSRFWVWDQYVLELEEHSMPAEELAKRVRSLPGVSEVDVDMATGSACVRVDRRRFDPARLWDLE